MAADNACKPGRAWGWRRWLAWGQLAAFVVIGVLLHRQHPAEYGMLPPCPSLLFLGLYCPGCGSTRGVHFLLNAEIGAAWRHNPALLVLGLPVLAWHVFNTVLLAFGWSDLRLRIPTWLIWSLLAVLLLYFAARNIPGQAFDQLRPPHSPV
jgi:hypothetical protein